MRFCHFCWAARAAAVAAFDVEDGGGMAAPEEVGLAGDFLLR